MPHSWSLAALLLLVAARPAQASTVFVRGEYRDAACSNVIMEMAMSVDTFQAMIAASMGQTGDCIDAGGMFMQIQESESQCLLTMYSDKECAEETMSIPFPEECEGPDDEGKYSKMVCVDEDEVPASAIDATCITEEHLQSWMQPPKEGEGTIGDCVKDCEEPPTSCTEATAMKQGCASGCTEAEFEAMAPMMIMTLGCECAEELGLDMPGGGGGGGGGGDGDGDGDGDDEGDSDGSSSASLVPALAVLSLGMLVGMVFA